MWRLLLILPAVTSNATRRWADKILGSYPPPSDLPSDKRPHPDWALVHRELRRRHVSLMLLWEEYCDSNSDSISYSWFCELQPMGWSPQADPAPGSSRRRGGGVGAGDRLLSAAVEECGGVGDGRGRPASRLSSRDAAAHGRGGWPRASLGDGGALPQLAWADVLGGDRAVSPRDCAGEFGTGGKEGWRARSG